MPVIFHYPKRITHLLSIYSEGVIVKWHKKEGDLIKKEDIICDIETKVSLYTHTCLECLGWSH